MFRVRYANLIASSTNGGQGLLCTISNVNVNYGLESGFLEVNPKNVGSSFANAAARVLSAAKFENSAPEGKRILIPKLIKVSMDLGVVHDHPLGWDFHTGKFRGDTAAPSFPYNFGVNRDASDAPAGNPLSVSETTAPTSPFNAVAAGAAGGIVE